MAKQNVLEYIQNRIYPRKNVNWPIEYRAFSKSKGLIHEGCKLIDCSYIGGCFLAMCDVEVGMHLNIRVFTSLSRKGRFLNLNGEVVRVDSSVDITGLFKAIGVRWEPGPFNKAILDQLIHAA